MKKSSYFKMPFATKHFNKNQKVWIQSLSGACAARVWGKFRGNHRYVSAWVNWWTDCRENPVIKEIEVPKEFYDRIKELS